MTSSGNEREASQQVARQTLQVHREGLELLRNLANQSNGELAATSGIELADSAVQFRLTVLSQTINHAWKIVDLIESGYPRVALSLARVLRESHIAVLWSIEESSFTASAFADLRESGSLERGPWPDAGKMAIRVVAALKAIGHSQVGDWDQVLRQYGDTQNQLFSHAVSNFSLTTGLIPDGKFSPVVGPAYVAPLVDMAIDHFMPLFSFLLNDSAKVAAAILVRDIPAETDRLLTSAGRWWQAHPPVQLASPAGEQEAASDSCG